MKHMKIIKKRLLVLVVLVPLLLIAKIEMNSQENLFWVMSPGEGSLDQTLVYEYKTGRLVCGQNGGLANE